MTILPHMPIRKQSRRHVLVGAEAHEDLTGMAHPFGFDFDAGLDTVPERKPLQPSIRKRAARTGMEHPFGFDAEEEI